MYQLLPWPGCILRRPLSQARPICWLMLRMGRFLRRPRLMLWMESFLRRPLTKMRRLHWLMLLMRCFLHRFLN